MQNSKIEWTDHTFNPWWGCQRVSPGCEHCYAETLARRYNFKVWGPAKTTSRRMMSNNYWKQPLKWNKAAKAAGVRPRVFCASMADVFEDHPELHEPRIRLFDLMDECQHLDWLLLTKRPENVRDMLLAAARPPGFPRRVWIGTSVEDQRRADERIPHLLNIPARVRFLSCEPLLGPVDLSNYLYPKFAADDPRH
jgi:protein gp37